MKPAIRRRDDGRWTLTRAAYGFAPPGAVVVSTHRTWRAAMDQVGSGPGTTVSWIERADRWWPGEYRNLHRLSHVM